MCIIRRSENLLKIELLINWTKSEMGVLGKISEVQQPNGLDLREVGSTQVDLGLTWTLVMHSTHTFKGNNTTTGT